MHPSEASGAVDLLAQMRQSVDALAETPVGVRDGDAGERITALAELRSAVDAQLLAELATFETDGGHQAAGCRSVSGWVRLHLRQTPGQAGATVGIARALGGLPVAAAALTDGAISIEHVAAIVGGIKRIGAGEMARHEQTLVDLAREASPAEVRAAVAEIVRLVEAESDKDSAAARAERRAAEAEASRCFTTRRVGDQVVFNGAVDVATGEALVNYIDAHAKPAPAADGARDERTAAQRRADAFALMVETAVGAPTDAGGMPERVRSTAAVTLTVSIETLLGLEGSDALLERLGRVPSPTARRLLCDGTLSRIILDPSGEPIDITGCGRSHTTGQARALALLHSTCAFPGCGVPFRMCHIHHVEHWIDGGPTELANLVPLCGTHHRFHHEGGYTITATAPGRVFTFHDALGRSVPDPRAALDHTTGRLALTIRSGVGARPPDGERRPARVACDAQRGSRRRDRWATPGPPYG